MLPVPVNKPTRKSARSRVQWIGDASESTHAAAQGQFTYSHPAPPRSIITPEVRLRPIGALEFKQPIDALRPASIQQPLLQSRTAFGLIFFIDYTENRALFMELHFVQKCF